MRTHADVSARAVGRRRALHTILLEGRKQAGLTQQQLAQNAGVSIGTVRKLETGGSLEPGFFVVGDITGVISQELATFSPAAASRFAEAVARTCFAIPVGRWPPR